MKLRNSLVDVTRAQQPESWHHGALVVARADGTFLGVVGEQSRIIFPRSSVKIIQALPLIENGAADRFGFTDVELALACASHVGTHYHTAIVEGVLRRLGLDRDALACGAHAPTSVTARDDLLRAGELPNRLHNNCSGKHAGMLATAVTLGEPVADYELAHHAVQRRIRTVMEEVTEWDLSTTIPGIEGCSLPNWPLPLDRLAIAFGRIVSGDGFAPERNAAFQRLVEACWAEPEAMSGKDRLDAQILKRFAGDVFIKTGAEGVYCGGIRSAGIGFALKVDDGAERAAEVAAKAVIARFVDGAADLGEPTILENADGIAVGDIGPGRALRSVLERIAL
jgi:L-asparaginase II